MQATYTRLLLAAFTTMALAVILWASPAGAQNAAASGSASLAATFDAHGGLDRFRRQAQMTYRMTGFPLSAPVARPNRSTVDLRTRHNRIDGDGFTVGFDGTQAWSVPGPDAVGLPPRFVSLGSFYFIGMPFVFGDAGAVVTPAASQTFRGRSYRVFKVGFRDGIGHTSEDDYVVFVDPDTDRLVLINHSVTENPDVDRVTWTFDRWQTVDGLVVPAQMTFYPGWNPTDPGAGNSFTIDDVAFSTTEPDQAMYAAPAGAVIDG